MRIFRRLVRVGLAIAALGLAAAPAAAQTPTAGTTIGNQAIATYQNAIGETVQVTSNLVETTVNQVRAVDIAADTAKDAAPGGKVFFPHTITNNGNGSDSFDITATAAGGTFTPTLVIYPDANLDGVPDNLTPIAVTPSLAPGEVFGIVVEANVPGTAAPATSDTFDVAVASVDDAGVTDSVTDTINVTGDAIINLTKSMTPAAVNTGDTVTVRLTYQNNGLVDATNVVITDQLPAGLTYDTGTAVWSDAGGASLTDTDADGNEVANGVGDNIDYSFDGTDTITAAIDNVPAGRTATITFTATVAATSGTVANTADFSLDNGTDGTSNEAVITINDSFAVTIGDSSATSTDNFDGATTSSTDDDGANNDIVEVDDNGVNAIPQGGIIPFEFVITNHANVSDTFNLTVANVDFPAGTSFSYTDVNGVPLTDSDGDGNPDTGSLASDGVTTVFLRADLPDSAAATGTGVDWNATVTATSSTNPATSNTSTANFTGDVSGAAVDIENDGGAADGAFTIGDTNPARTVAVDPGNTAQFTIVVENNGPTASSFDLEWTTTAPTDFVTFDTGNSLPAGWQVRFLDSGGAEVSNTGLIAGNGGTATLTAEVIVPAGATAGDTDIYFRAISPTNGAVDIKLDRVTVNSVVDVTIAPDRSTQASEGGTVVMSHTLTNNSNIDIDEGGITLAGYSAFSGTLFLDVNNNGVIDGVGSGGDVVIDNIDDIITAGLTFGPGDSVTIFNRVQVPATATAGQQETGTITVATSLNSGAANDGNTGNNTVEDTVTVVSGDLSVTKEQAVDTGCSDDGTGLTFSTTQQSVDPGQCIRYRIVAENTGTGDAALVTITDQTPSFTTFTNCTNNCAAAGTDGDGGSVTPTVPADGASGAVSASYGTLQPGEQAELQFTVRVDN